jgi:hypothetical protein
MQDRPPLNDRRPDAIGSRASDPLTGNSDGRLDLNVRFERFLGVAHKAGDRPLRVLFPVRGMFLKSAITRLIGAILLEQNDEWAVQRSRNMTLETMAPLSDDPIVSLPAVEV